MANFNPGQVITTFITKKGKEAIIRYPLWEDVESMTHFINEASQEDTYITFSGETISKEEESDFLLSIFKGVEFGNKIQLFCFVDGQLAGSCSVERNEESKKRSWHVGTFGIVIAKEYRGEGIGEMMAKTIIAETKKKLAGITLLMLCVYEPNTLAQGLYKKLGFVECGRIPKGVLYREQYVDEIKMFLNI